jgi:hypothetical protein
MEISHGVPGDTDRVVGIGLAANVSGSTTRPNDTATYASGDLIANSTTAGSVVPIALTVGRANGATGMIRALRLKVNDAAWKGATIRAHLFRDSPVVTVGDNGAFNASEVYACNEAAYMGYVDITLSQQFNDPMVKGFGARQVGSEWNFDCAAASQNIYALLEARSAITPAASKVFTLLAETLQN